MDGDRVLHASRVATREDDDERRPGALFLMRARTAVRACLRWGWGPPVIEDKRGAVPMMHVEIDDCQALDAPRLQHAHGDGHVVERAKPFAVVGERVMQAAADMAHHTKV